MLCQNALSCARLKCKLFCHAMKYYCVYCHFWFSYFFVTIHMATFWCLFASIWNEFLHNFCISLSIPFFNLRLNISMFTYWYFSLCSVRTMCFRCCWYRGVLEVLKNLISHVKHVFFLKGNHLLYFVLQKNYLFHPYTHTFKNSLGKLTALIKFDKIR